MPLRERTSGGEAGERHPRTKRRTRIKALAGLAGMSALIAMAFSAPSASAQTWSCDAYGYLFQTYTGATTSTIVKVDLATGEQIGGPSTPEPVNAVGFNPVDNYFYGMMQDTVAKTWQLVRIHADGSVDELGVPTGPGGTVDPVPGYPIGEVDSNGHYWLASGETWYQIDLNQSPPSVLSSGSMAAAREAEGLVGVGNDWSWIDGALYSFGTDANAVSYLVRFDVATKKFVKVGSIPVTGFGASFADAAGYIYGSQNATNKVFRIDPKTLETIESSNPLPGQPQSSPGNDGARCASAPIPTVTVTKTVEGRVRPADQFTVALLKPDGSTADSKTTSGTGTTVSTTNFPASQGKTYTITDAMAAGSPTPLKEYVASIKCTDSAGNQVSTGGTGPSWTLVIADPTDYTCNVTNKAESDLEMEKSSAPAPVVPGENATFTLKVTNKGPSASVGETVTDQLPAELSFLSASQGCTEAAGKVSCAIGELAAGASKTFDITGKVASSLERCLENTATVSGANDPDTRNNSATACAPIEGRADLSITKEPSAKTLQAGGQVMYTLVIKNKGPSDATGVKVEDPMAKGLTLASADPSQGSCSTAGGRVDCSLGRIGVGGSAQILVTANAGQTPGDITNTAKVRGNQVDPTPADNQDPATIKVEPGPKNNFDLEVTKKASTTKPVIGQQMTFQLTVRNNGPQTAPSATLTDTLNTRARIISATPSAGTCTVGNPLSCQLGDIPAGGTVTVKVVAKPKRAGRWVRNAASITGDGNDNTPNNNIDSIKLGVRKVKLKVTKTATRKSVPAGQTLGYTIEVENLTKGVARQVRVCDRLPRGMAFVSSAPKGKPSRGQMCWRIKSLGPRGKRSFSVVVKALKGSSGRKVNRATATSPDASPAAAKRAVRIAGGNVSAAGGVTG